MKKKLLTIVAALALAFLSTGCVSNGGGFGHGGHGVGFGHGGFGHGPRYVSHWR